VPFTREEFENRKFHLLVDFFGEDAFALFMMIAVWVFGWPAYLITNETGGRVQADLKTPMSGGGKSHFFPNQIFPERWHARVWGSTVGLLCFAAAMVYCFQLKDIAYWYGGPYLVVNGWLTMYTYLQHTSPEVPQHNSEDYTQFQGAISTIDRPYNAITNFIHHDIGSSHVVHHINSAIPFYKAKQLTPEVAKILRKHNLYNFDSTPILAAFFYTARRCHYVESTKGTQYLQSRKTMAKEASSCGTPDNFTLGG
jgi:omega-6 fatty acid desaturase (delta-12 desaturase)